MVYEFKRLMPVLVVPPPMPVAMPAKPMADAGTVLRHCRCIDCRHWDHRIGLCWELGLRRYVSKDQYPPPMQRFWTNAGMIQPDQWHFCGCYQGPQLSKDVWVWTKEP